MFTFFIVLGSGYIMTWYIMDNEKFKHYHLKFKFSYLLELNTHEINIKILPFQLSFTLNYSKLHSVNCKRFTNIFRDTLLSLCELLKRKNELGGNMADSAELRSQIRGSTRQSLPLFAQKYNI